MNHLRSTITSLIFVLAVVTASATENPSQVRTGSFGVCDCQSKNNKTKIIELSLNQDSTFNYVDNSDPNHKLALTGKWTAKGDHLYLISSDKRKSFHRKWKFESNGQCIKSRYQLNFRRICLMKPC